MLEVHVRDGKFVVTDNLDEVKELNLGNYVRSFGGVVLDVSEVAYIMYRNLGKLVVDDKELTLDELFTYYSRSQNDWIKFVVLCDLRDRGRKAKAGFSDNSLIFERDGKYMVYVTEENSPITPNDLVNWLSSAISKEYEPLIAVVDAHGDVTYYELLSVRAYDLKEVIV
ncbi:MAG: hypothetical protein RMH77_07015 [Sulfolobales archaeon]|nr:hypothetical protein [Sulfolobales archaeon]MDW7970129.1 hypothetical protein [Sulfolobales archaeon]